MTVTTEAVRGVTPFAFTGPTEVWFGPGRRSEVGAALERCEASRAVLVTTRRSTESGMVDELRSAPGGERIVGTFDEVTPHSSLPEVDRLVARMTELDADSAVALGGGSVLAAAKCAVAVVSEGRPIDRISWSYDPDDGTLRIPKMQARMLPIVALPTTSGSASETNRFGSVRDPATGEKVRVRHPGLSPRIAILDPELTVSLSRSTTAGTGVNAFAHCIEVVYSTARDPISTGLALAAAAMIVENLPRCCEDPHDIDARGAMQVATAMSGLALNNTLVALHHGMCHPLGQICGLSHGLANYVMLPHALAFNVEAAAPELAALGRATGLLPADAGPGDAPRFVAAVGDWVASLDGRISLADTGQVTEADLPVLARSALHDPCLHFNPRPVTDVGQLEAIYRSAWSGS